MNKDKTLMELEACSSYQKVSEQIKNNIGSYNSIISNINIKNINVILTIARGSSDHAALYANYMFFNNLGVITSSLPLSVISHYNANIHSSNIVCLSISQSGKSPDLLKSVQYFKSINAYTISMVNDINSPLSVLSNYMIPLYADSEKSVAATKSYICSLSSIANLIGLWSNNRSLLFSLQSLPLYLYKSSFMDWSQAINICMNITNCYILGRGYSYAIAQEAALKFKETSNIHAEAFSSAEVLHGPFALLKDRFVVFIFGQNDSTLNSTLLLAKRIKALGCQVLLAVPGINNMNTHNVDYIILPTYKSLHPMLDPILIIQSFYIMVAQLSVLRGFNPDNPVNLKKITETL